MIYSVKSIFLTLQGEGARVGSKSAFLRFAGCNLWSGHEAGRERGAGACARWCDTDFVGGERIDASQITRRLNDCWPHDEHQRWVVITGGEPALQLDDVLIGALHSDGWKITIETNGTCYLPDGINWVTVSPKRGSPLRVTEAHELKVVLPGDHFGGWSDDELLSLEATGSWQHLFVQPQASSPRSLIQHGTERRCIDFVMRNPRWRLSTQTHKEIGIP